MSQSKEAFEIAIAVEATEKALAGDPSTGTAAPATAPAT
jgi:hypothetical protein